MFTKKVDSIQLAKASMELANLRADNDKLSGEKTRLTRIIRRLLEFHGVKANYIGYRSENPYVREVPYLDVDRLDADLEAVYAVTKADAARARLTETETTEEETEQ